MSLPVANLRWVTTNLDHKRIPLNGSERGERQGEIPYWGANGIVDYVDDYLINEPVVLIGEDGAPFLDPHKEVAFEVDGPIWPNNHIHILRPDREKVTDGFLRHWLNTVPYALYINGSTRDKLTQAQLGSIKIKLPPLETQKRIAAFLDEKTAQIDGLIARKQALLARLAEKRQAIITQAVTKGLNPAAPLKDSGIDWLGQIPAHWEVVPLRRMASRVVTGRTPPAAAGDFFTDGEVPWFTPGDFKGALVLDGSEKCLTQDAFSDGHAVLYPANSVLLVGIGATLGKVAVAPMACSSNQQINAITPLPENDAVFLAYFLHGFRNEVRVAANGNTLPILNQDKTKAIAIVRPVPEEQKQISAHLIEADRRIEFISFKIAASVDLLNEVRATLITRAVTGQIEGLN